MKDKILEEDLRQIHLDHRSNRTGWFTDRKGTA